ncbi:hypothetical protein EP47_11665 [Legionella norrlandica]|uniref:Uncharacterized protein n=1 Tax=Legionella norrlandica TaxID=1498499 RepID=A0A0A2TAK3_9GAMM|nr:hypothetical protein [Legionella norrlandica]KGP64418.1 hypothetical protein EP47_11665 [Legionella norrlandica]
MINFISMVFFLLTVIFISRARKAKNQMEYVTAGKQTSVFPLVSTLVMTEINPMALIAMASLGYQAGYWALWMAVIAFLGPLFAALTTSKKWKDFNSTCVSTLFDKCLGYIILFVLLLSTNLYEKAFGAIVRLLKIAF